MRFRGLGFREGSGWLFGFRVEKLPGFRVVGFGGLVFP